jgi:Holliday junction resolvase RusA-like endonuclease
MGIDPGWEKIARERGLIPAEKPRACRSVIVELPPSLNNLFPTSRSGKRFKSRAYTVWQATQIPILRQLESAKDYPVELWFTVNEKTRIDIDNLNKALCDGLKVAGVIKDDKPRYVCGVHIVYRPTEGGYGVKVEILETVEGVRK